MAEEMMNTKEVARYLGVHEKHVYAMISQKKLPATRITGKWVFPRKLIDEWVESSAVSGLEQSVRRTRKVEGGLVASGNNDLVLDLLLTEARMVYPDFCLLSAHTGGVEGLKALNMGYADIAWAHLFDPESGQYNIPFLQVYAPTIRPAVINLYYRDLGFLVAANNPLGVNGFEDLARKGVRFVNRQKGSDTRTLIDHHLARLGIDPLNIRGYENEVHTHLDIGLSVFSNETDVGIATPAVSRLFGLSFIPVTRERFDMILDQHTFFQGGVQALMEVLKSEGFREKVARLGNYDCKDSGRILYAP
ncbi:MAG: helix-turn-helix transcriptional regulator [Syntrophorhabdales bacterium]|jgi:excisionase family DNA binding protein